MMTIIIHLNNNNNKRNYHENVSSDAQELQSWVDTINLVAGTLSAPPLPSAVGSKSKKFQKPLLPSSHTKFNTKEQLADHEMRIQRIAQDLEEHVSKHPDKGAQRRILNEYAEKQSYLEYEVSVWFFFFIHSFSSINSFDHFDGVNIMRKSNRTKIYHYICSNCLLNFFWVCFSLQEKQFNLQGFLF